MYQIIVVDDNDIITHALSKHISNILAEDSTVYIAHNGSEALNLLSLYSPDILLTDIKMPVMDGFELIQQALHLLPELQCVIISGYDDFQLAKQAIQLHVDEYLLKPVDEEELKTLLYRLIEKIDSKRYQRRRDVLSALLHGEVVSHDEQALVPQGNYYLTLLRQGLCRSAPKKIPLPPIERRLPPCLSRSMSWLIRSDFAQEAVLLSFSRLPTSRADCTLKEWFEELCPYYPQLNALISQPLDDISQLRRQYQQLSNQLTARISVGRSALYWDEFHAPVFPEQELLILFNEAKIGFIIRNGHQKAFQKELEAVLERCALLQLPFFFMIPYFSFIIEQIDQHTRFSGAAPVDIRTEIDHLLYGCYSYSDILSKLVQHFSLSLERKQQSKPTAQLLAQNVETFMRTHLYDTLSMQDLSAVFGFSESYITRLFKKSFGKAPMEYYLLLKVTEAKHLIKQNHNLYIKDISLALGFSDQHYFSRVFKESVGISPVEYRDGFRK